MGPFNFRPHLIFGRGWPKIKRGRKSQAFFGWPKIKGPEIFPKLLYNIKTKTEICYKREWPKTKGAELGRVAGN